METRHPPTWYCLCGCWNLLKRWVSVCKSGPNWESGVNCLLNIQWLWSGNQYRKCIFCNRVPQNPSLPKWDLFPEINLAFWQKKPTFFLHCNLLWKVKKKNLACTELMNSVTEFSSQKGLSPPGPLWRLDFVCTSQIKTEKYTHRHLILCMPTRALTVLWPPT